MPGVILRSRMPQVARPVGGSAPDPGFFEGVGASFRLARDDQAGAEIEHLTHAYKPIVDTLTELNGKPWTLYVNPRSGQTDFDGVWAAVDAERARDPKAFANLPKTRAEFDVQARKDILTRIRKDEDTVARGGWGAMLTGGMAGGLTDPINLGTMLIGGGPATSLGKTILKGAIINGATELVETPLVAHERAKAGRDFTAREAVTNVLVAGLAGGVLDGATKIAGDALPRIGGRIADAREAGIAAVWDKLPEGVRTRWAKASDITDADLPDLAEMVIGRGRMSADEKAAVAVVRREAEMARINPFAPDGAGLAAHQERMADAMTRILADVPPVPRMALRGSTAISSGVVDPSARAAVKARIAVVESGGSNVAANRRSSARGKYQFLERTWLSYFTRRFGTAGLTKTEILAKRSDGRLQDILMDDLMVDNAAFLHRQGVQETAGNLYLTHFAGQEGARKLFEAEPGARAIDLLGAKVVEANPFLRDMTARDVIAWAHERMGGAVPERARAQAMSAEGERPELVMPEEPDPAARAADAEPVFADTGDVPMPAGIDFDQHVAPILPDLRAIVADRGRSINAIRAIADELDIPEAHVRRGLIELATGREIRMNRNGTFSRQPQSTGPVDALKFIARIGVSDHEGHRLGRNGRDLDRFVPGAGPLIRKSGKSVDEVGEALWDAGYFGPPSAVARPDENAVLDMIERAATGEKIYAHGVEAPDTLPPGTLMDAEERAYLTGMFGAEAERLNLTVDDGLLHAASRRYNSMSAVGDATPEQALRAVLREHLEELAQDVRSELRAAGDDGPFHDFDAFDDFAGYDDGFDPLAEPGRYDRDPHGYLFQQAVGDGAPGDAGPGAAMGGRSEAVAGDAGEGGAGGAVAGTARGPIDDTPLSPETAKAFEDPTGAEAAALADSLAHDARAALGLTEATDPAIAARQKEEAALKAASPMRAATDQESTIGAPLFDAADMPRFQLDEGDGARMSLPEILDQIDADEAVIKSVKDCL